MLIKLFSRILLPYNLKTKRVSKYFIRDDSFSFYSTVEYSTLVISIISLYFGASCIYSIPYPLGANDAANEYLAK